MLLTPVAPRARGRVLVVHARFHAVYTARLQASSIIQAARASAFYPRGELGGMSRLHTGTPRDVRQRRRVERQQVVKVVVP